MLKILIPDFMLLFLAFRHDIFSYELSVPFFSKSKITFSRIHLFGYNMVGDLGAFFRL